MIKTTYKRYINLIMGEAYFLSGFAMLFSLEFPIFQRNILQKSMFQILLVLATIQTNYSLWQTVDFKKQIK